MSDEGLTSEVESTESQSPEQGAGTEGAQAPEITAEQLEAYISGLDEDKLSKLPALERRLQSLKDKEAARIERQYRERARTEAERRRREAEEREWQALEETEDFDAIGRRTAQSRAEQRRMAEAAGMVSGVIEQRLKDKPEFKALGEETIERIYEQVREDGGTIDDFAVALGKEVTKREVSTVASEIQKQMKEEMEALRVELGLSKRSNDEDEGNAPARDVSRAGGRGGMTPEKYLSLSDDEFDALPNSVHLQMTRELERRRSR